MPGGLYEVDALAWAERQATLLRRLAAGEGVNEHVDWAHVIEEVEDVGLSELRACRALLLQAMTHLLKLHVWPGSAAGGHWRAEAGTFLDDAEQRFTASMAQRIALDGLYERASRRVGDTADESGPGLPLPAECPFTLAALLAGSIPELLAAIASKAP